MLKVHLVIDCIAEELGYLNGKAERCGKTSLKKPSLNQFWANVPSMDPINLSNLYKLAATTLLPFPTACLLEFGFFTSTMIKTKHHSKLQ